MLQHFTNKWAIVTGIGLKNMGQAIAIALAKHNIRIILVGYDTGEVKEIGKEIRTISTHTPFYLTTDFCEMNVDG